MADQLPVDPPEQLPTESMAGRSEVVADAPKASTAALDRSHAAKLAARGIEASDGHVNRFKAIKEMAAKIRVRIP